MCDLCRELDRRIDHYRLLSSRVTDRWTLDGIDILIAKLGAEKKALHPEYGTTLAPSDLTDEIMRDDSEIDWHRGQIAKNRELIAELETSNAAGGDVFPETKAEIERLRAQVEQSELIVAAHEKHSRQGER